MPHRTYRLKYILQVARTDSPIIPNTVTIVSQSPEEAIEQAKFFIGSLPPAALMDANLINSEEICIWSNRRKTKEIDPQSDGNSKSPST